MSNEFRGVALRGTDDIEQCINNILNTQKGSAPLRPLFGIDVLSFLDRPHNVAGPFLRQEIIKGINTWEPRVKIKSVTFEVTALGQLTFNIFWSSASGNGGNQITI